MWDEACSSLEEEYLNIHSQTAFVANSRVCCCHWLCRAGFYHPSTPLAIRASSLSLPANLSHSNLHTPLQDSCHSSGCIPSEKEKGLCLQMPLHWAVHCFVLPNSVGPSLGKFPILSGHSWTDVWGHGPLYHTAGNTECLVTGATAGTFTSDVRAIADWGLAFSCSCHCLQSNVRKEPWTMGTKLHTTTLSIDSLLFVTQAGSPSFKEQSCL